MKIAFCFCALVLAGGSVAGAASAHEPLGFSLDITLSPKAAERLRATHEGIAANASYYGNPTAAAAKHGDEVGHIDLGVERHDLSAQAGRVRFTGHKVMLERLPWVDGGVKVNVNVYSARRSNEDNILACDFIDTDLAAVVKAQPVTLHCGLITENLQTQLRP